MKILFINTDISYGGGCKMIVDIANALSKDHIVDFLTFRNDNISQPLDEKINHIHDPLFKHKFKPIEIIGQIIKLHAFLKNGKYDVAIAFLHPSNYMITLASKGTKTKVLLSERADPYSRRKNGGLFVHCVEYILHLADGYVFQSDGAKELYPKKCQKKGVVIVNSIPDDLKGAQYIGERKKTIVHVARMELIQKRQDIMLKAFKIFLESHPEYILEFYGDGPDEEKVKRMTFELGIDDKVIFMGAQKNVLGQIADAGMFVLTSDYEGVPNALLEAEAIGLPCISTDCSPGGARMIIENDHNGFIVPRGDYMQLAEKMTELAGNNEKASAFSKNAVNVIDKFNPLSVYPQWKNIVEKVAKKGK